MENDDKTVHRTSAPFVKAVSAVFTLLLLYVAFALLIPGASLFGRYQYYVILTGSMRPTIEVGDVVFVNHRTSLSSIESGDIVAFYADVTADGENDVVVHYVHDVDRSNGTFTTRAENTTTPDPWTLSESDLVGVYSMRVPRIGRFLLFAQTTLGRIVIAVDIALIYVIYRLWIKDKDKEESKKEKTT